MQIKSKEILIVDIDSLVQNPKNNNKHSKEQIERLAKLIKHHGLRNPLVISNRSGFVIAGNGRIEAAKLAGLKEVPVMRQDFDNEASEYAYLTSDNAIASWSELDMSMVNTEMLNFPDLDIDLLGIKDFELVIPEVFEPLTDEDAVPEVVHPITRRGDIWLLGNHRLMCGDSTMIDDVEKLMNGEKADMVFTSPPYNANTKAGQGDIFNGKKSKKLYAEGYSDNLESNQYLDFTKTVLENCFSVTEGFIFWSVSYNANSLFEYIKQIEDRIEFLIEQICWKKTSTIPFKGSLMRDW